MINHIPVIHNVSLQMLNYNSTTINGSCNECLCIMLLNITLIFSFNCFQNNKTCEIFSISLNTNTFLLINNTESSVYFISLPINNSTLTITSTAQTTSSFTSITLLTTTTDIAYGVWNTTVGCDSIPSTVGTGIGNYYSGEYPNNAFDRNNGTKYTSFGICILSGTASIVCGQATGLYVTPQGGSSLLQVLQFCTGNDLPDRDPLTITVEGSNESASLLTFGSSWTLIYNGSTGLDSITSRQTCGTNQTIFNNLIWYSSYRILVTSKRGVEIATQYSEINLMGYQ